MVTPLDSADNFVDLKLLRRAISPRLWKHVLLLCLILFGLSAMLWRQHLSSFDAAANSARAFPTANLVVGLLLLLAGQLATVVGWLRSMSEVDFQGRYRWWKWLATGYVCFAAVVLTQTTGVLPELMATALEPLTGRIQAARHAIVIVPVLTFAAVVLSRVLPDMSRCLWSQGLLVLALLTSVVRFMLSLSSVATPIHPGLLSSLEVAAAFSAFAAMLLHCRFVGYVCNDPPIARPQAQQATESPSVEEKVPEASVLPAEAEQSAEAAAAKPTAAVDEQPPSKTLRQADTAAGEQTGRRKGKSKRRRKAA